MFETDRKKTLILKSSIEFEWKTIFLKLSNGTIFCDKQKNDQEKKYIKIAQSYKQQTEVITKLQEKLKKTRTVEEALKKQEKVIEKMERILEKQHRDRSKKSNGQCESQGQGDVLFNVVQCLL